MALGGVPYLNGRNHREPGVEGEGVRQMTARPRHHAQNEFAIEDFMLGLLTDTCFICHQISMSVLSESSDWICPNSAGKFV